MFVKVALAAAAVAIPMAAQSCDASTAMATAKVGKSCRAGLSSAQASSARAVIKVGDQMRLPQRAKVIAIATTLQESNLNRYAVGDGGRAVGLFQQHPHWGGSRTDPAVSARRFYSRLVKVSRWQSRPLTEAAQAVQRSAHPTAYARHEGRAARIVATLSSARCK